MIKAIYIGILLMIAGNSYCQQFEFINNRAEGLSNGSMITADLNIDGILDLVISGMDQNGNYKTRIYSVGFDGDFTLSYSGFLGFQNPIIDLSDVNNDAYNDILISGLVERTLGTAYRRY